MIHHFEYASFINFPRCISLGRFAATQPPTSPFPWWLVQWIHNGLKQGLQNGIFSWPREWIRNPFCLFLSFVDFGNIYAIKIKLGGGFKYFFFVPRSLGKWFNLTCAYFSNGLVQPPTCSRCTSRFEARVVTVSGDTAEVITEGDFRRIMVENGRGIQKNCMEGNGHAISERFFVDVCSWSYVII